MRIVVSSDWHGDVSTLGVSRLPEVRRAVMQSVQHAIDVRADAYLCLGDVSDPDNGGVTLQAIALAVEVAVRLRTRGIMSIFVAGNHDATEDGTGVTVLSPLAALGDPLVHVAERPRLVRVAGAAILCLPYAAASCPYDPDMQARVLLANVSAATPVVVASHLTVLPGVSFGDEADMPRGRELLFPIGATNRAVLRLQGHWHRRQTVDVGSGAPVEIPGSLARLVHGEESNEPRFLDVEVGGSATNVDRPHDEPPGSHDGDEPSRPAVRRA